MKHTCILIESVDDNPIELSKYSIVIHVHVMMAFLSSQTNQVQHPFGCKKKRSVVVIVTEKTSHINILFFVLFLFLNWCGSSGSSSSSWSSSTHSGHLGKTSG